jgi:serine/threonine protein kinase/WD40 repeat protein
LYDGLPSPSICRYLEPSNHFVFMTDSHPHDSLSRALWIDKICDQFESAWLTGPPPCLEEYLAPLSAEDRIELLLELAPIELHHRRRLGEQPLLDEFGLRFSGIDQGLLAKLFQAPHVTLGEAATNATRVATHDVDPIDLPGYEVLGELGRGGMGIVYQARQLKLGRQVALKMVLDSGTNELQRLQAEAMAIARLQHPNIVQIHEVGEHGGRPYLALEFVDGGTLGQKIAGVPQPPRDAARLVETLARAIHQAHQAGIVHRDLKPANILLTQNGSPKITDFGLAKQLDVDHATTVSGLLVGTPQYMAPEQASADRRRVGPATDIYALGAILYELLTGRPPFQGSNLQQLLRDICDSEPTSPRQLKLSTPRDLETICLKCLHKAPSERYASAAELADDLQRFLCDQPILARPSSGIHKSWRWCRRNPWIAVPTAALAVLLVLVTIGSLLVANRFAGISSTALQSAHDATKARQLADQRARETRLELARSRINEARMLRRSQRVGQYSEAIARVKEARDVFRELEDAGYPVSAADWSQLRNEAASTLLVPDLLTRDRWKRKSRDLPTVATDVVHERYIRIDLETPTQAEICRFGSDEPIGRIPAPAECGFTHGMFSGEGNHLVLFATPDDQMQFWDVRGTPQLIRSEPGEELSCWLADDGSVYASYVEPRGTRVARVQDGQQIAETTQGVPLEGFPIHPDGQRVAITDGLVVRVFDFVEQRIVWETSAVADARYAVWSRDGRCLLLSTGHAIHAFAADNGVPLTAEAGKLLGKDITPFPEELFPIPLSDSRMFASINSSALLCLSSFGTGRIQLKSANAFFDRPRAFGADARFTLTYAGGDYVTLQTHTGRLSEFAPSVTDRLAMSPSGRLLAVHREPGGLAIYHLPAGELLGQVPSTWGDWPLGFLPEDRGLLVYGMKGLGQFDLTPLDASETRWRLGTGELAMGSLKTHDRCGMDRDGATIAVPEKDDTATIYHRRESGATSVKTPKHADVWSAEVSPDGRWVVLGSHNNGTVALYSATDGAYVRELSSEAGEGRFSPDGRWLAVQRLDGT